MKVDFFDVYYALMTSGPWPQPVQDWSALNPGNALVLNDLRRFSPSWGEWNQISLCANMIDRIVDAVNEASRDADMERLRLEHHRRHIDEIMAKGEQS